MSKQYSEYLKNPKWQKKRLQIFERDAWTCQSCGKEDKTLHVHHLKYLPSLKPWEYEDCYLITYCEKCHNTEHLIGDTIRESFAELQQANSIFIKPLSQINVLIEDYPPFYTRLKSFLNDMMIEFLKSKSRNKAA